MPENGCSKTDDGTKQIYTAGRRDPATGSALPVQKELSDMTTKPKITDGFQAAEQATSETVEATVTNIKDGIATATAGFEATQSKLKEGMEKAMKTAEEFVAFNQGNVEAIVKSGQIWASGVQDLSKHFAAAAKASMDEGMAAFKALTAVKSLKDAIELQTSFARSALEKTMAESGKLTDASIKLTEQTLAPITARVTVAVEKFAKAA
jgi:phasin family protein